MSKLNAFGLQTKTSEHVEPPPAKKQMLELRKILLEQRAELVVTKLLDIALNDEHPQQMAAVKTVIERVLPMSEFEKEGAGSGIKVYIDRSCGGKLTLTVGGVSNEVEDDPMGSPLTLENGE